MKLHTEIYEDAASFADAVMKPVAKRAIANNTFLGVLERTLRSKNADHLRAAVWDGDQLVLAALMTPPYVLNIADPGRGREGVVPLADALANHGYALPGCVSETPTADAFAAAWSARHPVRVELEHRHLLYQCESVIEPHAIEGRLVRAQPANVERHVDWEVGFAIDIDAPSDQRERTLVEQRVRRWLDAGVLFDWKVKDTATAHGVVLPIGKDGARVLAIYTPPEKRGRGYAQAMTAALTQRALDEGRWCTLFTDADNPITNKIYPRIGYRLISPYTSFRFRPL
ncbi:MAG: GNAT family N-acetyltransferase [Alphaproteobacteria bacterium]|nr:GNAT family N-acetyltransferase [Alphaproteobacteria bacterium]